MITGNLLTTAYVSCITFLFILKPSAKHAFYAIFFSLDFRLMTDLPDRHICFIHAKIGASPGWGGASRLVSIIGGITECLRLKISGGRALLTEFFELDGT